ncbi:MAG: hypothetical protein J6M42_01575 [Clostridia bacterium]|nr:hypothetical protein [Clostridia bacterium]
MKRILLLLLTAALLLTPLLTLTACGDETARLEGMSEEKRAARLLKLAEEALTAAESTVIRRTLTVKNPYFGATISETETTSCVMTKGNYGYLRQLRTELGAGQNIRSTSVYGYRDGYAFKHHSQDSVSSFFKAPAEEEDFRATSVKDSDTPPLRLRIDGDTCKSITSEKTDDGKWKVICTGFGDAKAAGFLDRQHDYASDLTVSHKPWDLEITLIMTEELKPGHVSVKVIFHESKEYPRAEPSALTQYDFKLDTEEAQTNISSIPLEKYTELPDLAVLTAFFDQLTVREKAAKGELSVDNTTTLKSGGESQTATLSQTMTYGSAGGYRFTYKYGEPDGKSYELAYAGTRLLRTTYGKMGNKIETKSTRMLDAQARLTVQSCMNPHTLNPADVQSAMLISEGSGLYRYELSPEAAAYKSSLLLRKTFTKTKVEVTEASCTVEAQIPKGVLESYTLTLFADATVDGLPLTLEITVTVIFYDLS